MMRILIQLLALYLGGTPLYAGTTEATHLLSRGPGAQAAALGQAVLPLVQDPTALYWNPAALSRAGGAIAGEHLFLLGGARYNFVGVSLPSKAGTFGLGMLQLHRGGITARRTIDDIGTEVSSSQIDYLLGYATPLRRGWSAGATANLLSYNIAGHKARGLGLDLGLSGRWPPEGFMRPRRGLLRFGGVVKNLVEPSLTLDRDAERLPRELRWGAAWLFDVLSRIDPENGAIRYDRAALTAAMKKTKDVPGLKLGLGLSYVLRNTIVLRLGYDRGLAAGLGFKTSDGRFNMDYALENKPLSKNHRFTVSYRFAVPAEGKDGAALSEADEGYRTARDRAKALSNERLAGGKTLFVDARYAEAAERLDEAAILFPDDSERRTLAERAREAYRRARLKDLNEDFRTALKSESLDEAMGTLESMLEFGPAPAELARLADEVAGVMGEDAYSTRAARLAAAGKRRVLALLADGDLAAAVRRAELLAALGLTNGSSDRLTEWTKRDAARRRLKIETALKDAKHPRVALEQARALRRAYPEDREAERAFKAARKRYAPEPTLSGRERLYLRKLYYLAAIRYAKREFASAFDLLGEILRRNAADADAAALRERLALAGAAAGTAGIKEER